MKSLAAGAFAVLFLSACSTQIQHGLDERAANEIQSVLVERGFEARKRLEPGKKPTWTIEVPDERATDAVRVLSELGLPRPKADGFSELFGKGSLVPTPTEERALFVQALSGELSQTLEAVDGVAAARVHLVVPPAPRPGLEPVPSKAAAYLRVHPGRGAELQALRPELASLIAGSVDGLSPQAVTLVLDEVSSTVTAPAVPPHLVSSTRLRVLLATFGGAVVLLAALALGLTWKLRQTATAPTLKATPIKPSVATAARKVA